LLGHALFSEVLQARFASFQVFGGIVFLLIGLQFIFNGPGALRSMRGAPGHIAGSVALPIMIGPGTISASILAGGRLPPVLATVGICLAVVVTVLTILLLKDLHDFVLPRNARLVERYIEVMGRVMALVVGTFSIEMIMQGIGVWLHHFSLSCQGGRTSLGNYAEPYERKTINSICLFPVMVIVLPRPRKNKGGWKANEFFRQAVRQKRSGRGDG
jgi:small neutral amino acid transporter SnatA (MarC family)